MPAPTGTMRCALVIALAACGQPMQLELPDAAPSPAFASERNFVVFGHRHIYYTLFSADADPAGSPLFVFFNGGPGFPTTLGLLADTAPMAVAADGSVHANPASFTALGSLLYIDQPLSGFSYDEVPAAGFGFDMAKDALDFARTIVAVLDSHPEIQAAPVVIVGESYGGVRAELLLDDLLDYTAHAALAADAQPHFDAIFPAVPVHAAEEIATQFGAQVLIEPVVVGAYQLEASHLQGSSDLDYGGALIALDDPVAGTAWLGGRLEDIPGLAGPARHGFRGPIGTDKSQLEIDLEARLGPLDPGDAYFSGGPTGSDWAGDTTLVPPAFVRNLHHVRTFVTHALDDGIVDTTAIAGGLGLMGITATVDPASPAGTARPGEIAVTLPSGDVTIRFPSYEAKHQVTQTQAAALRDDVAAWLALRSVGQ